VCGMLEVKRDAAADLAMCEAATPGKWEGKHAIQPYISVFTGVAEEVIATTYTRGNMRFIAESRTALPHWIKRAQDAEKRISAACDKINSLITLISMAGGAGESVDIWGLSSELCAIASELNSE
jgi:hypothetical protein